MADAFKLRLFKNRSYADVTFVVDGSEVKANKCVLVGSCDYFQNFFHKITVNRIPVNDTSFKAFNEVINYCYLDKIDITEWLYKEKMDLHNLATRYKYQALIELVEKELEKPSQVPFTVETLNELNEMRSPEEIRGWVEDNLSYILSYKDCHKYSKDLINFIVDTLNKIYDTESDRCKLQLVQKEVLNWLFRWRNSSNRNEEDVESIYQRIKWPSAVWLYFQHPMKSTQEWKTNQSTPKEIQAMLHFWRTKQVDSTGWSCEEILQLLVVANAYDFGPLSDALENIVSTQYLEPSSLVLLHGKAFELDSGKLQRIIADYIKNSTMEILSSAEFINYPGSLVGFILENLMNQVMDTEAKILMLTSIRKWKSSKSEEEVKKVFDKIRYVDFLRESLADVSEYLFKDETSKDVTFVFEKHEIKAHKMVLAYNCDHFEQLFNENKEKRLIMHATSFMAFKEVVNYCYLEKIGISQWYYNEKKDLYNLAKYYKYQSLTELMRDELQKPSEVPITVNNLNELYDKKPRKVIRRWVKENIDIIVSNGHCSHYSKDLVVFIRDTFYDMYDNCNDKFELNVPKRNLHPWIFQWIKLSNGKDDYSVLQNIRWEFVPYEQKPFIGAFLKVIRGLRERSYGPKEQPELRGRKRKHE